MAGKCNFTNNNPLHFFPPFFLFFPPPFFFFWIRFKQVHRNRGCFGSKLSRGRGKSGGCQKVHELYPEQPLPRLAATLPCPRVTPRASLGSQRPPSRLSSLQQLDARTPHLRRVTASVLGGAPGREARSELSSSLPLPPLLCSGLSLLVAPAPFPQPQFCTFEQKGQRDS